MDLKQAYRALDPAHPLEPDSAFYAARPDNPVSRIVAELKLTDTPRRYLLTGHRGTGKTTELRRIEQELTRSYVVHLVFVGASVTSLIEQVTQGLDRFFLERFHRRSEDTIESLLDFQDESDDPSVQMLWQIASEIASLEQPLLILIDGIDKLHRGYVGRHLKELVKMCSLPLSIVCTIPLAATLEPNFGDITPSIDSWYFLPCIDLWTRDGARIPEGWELCKDVIERRAAGVFADEALELLVENGAGIHRELLRLAQRACVFAAVAGRTSVEQVEVARAVQEIRNEYSIMLRSEDHALLQKVARTGRISGDPDLLRLVRDQFVVAYGGGGTWFAVHPMVRPLIADEREVASG